MFGRGRLGLRPNIWHYDYKVVVLKLESTTSRLGNHDLITEPLTPYCKEEKSMITKIEEMALELKIWKLLECFAKNDLAKLLHSAELQQACVNGTYMTILLFVDF